MGFDVSYHPISVDEMNRWYFDRLEEAQNNDWHTVKTIAEKYDMDDFCVQKYIDTLTVAAQTASDELFDKTHSYYLAVVQGFYRAYYYTRGTAFSFLLGENKSMARYTDDIRKFSTCSFENPIQNSIVENYCGGVFIPFGKVLAILQDYQNGDIKSVIDNFFEENTQVFMNALEYARNHQLGVLEATEVVEVNPLDLNTSRCYSYLMNCDQEGALLYAQIAKRQIEECAAAREIDSADILNNAEYETTYIEPEPEPVKRGFFGKMFKK